MIFTIAGYILEGTISTTVWGGRKLYNWWYEIPSNLDLQEEIRRLTQEVNRLKLKNQ